MTGCTAVMPKTMLAARVLILLLGTLSTLVPVPASAQTEDLDLRIPPPVTGFETWRMVGEDDFTETYSVGFRSPVETAFETNDQVRLKVVLPKNRTGRVPVVVLLHYWGATETSLEDEMGAELALKGIASVAMPLPYHLSRTPDGYRSGELAIQADPVQLKATMSQAVLDVRRCADWIGTRPEFDSGRIGLTGTSLGAIVSSLAYAVDERFGSAAFILGGVDLAHILWNSSRVVGQRDQLRRMGYTEESLRAALVSVEPSEYLEGTAQRPTYVVKARHDNVVPPKATEDLIAMLGDPEILVLETGHYGGFLVRSRLVRSVSGFFSATFDGQEFQAPANFYTPTIRFGIGVDAESGLNVSAGLDVWRLNAESDLFASFLLTPRGPQGFIGGSLGRGVALGVVILPRKTTFGMLWNTVF